MSRPTNQNLEAAWSLIDQAQSIAVLMHVNPDGDALGSAMGLAFALRHLGKDAHLYCQQELPEIYSFLSPEKLIERGIPDFPVDLAIIVDCDRPDRTGPAEPVADSAKKTMVIDHHPPTSDFGDLRIVEPSCAATAELIYYILHARKVKLDKQIAEALLTALITDTGAFRFRNTTPDTFLIASELAKAGPVTAEITEKIYESRSLAGLKLLGRALNSLKLSPSGKVVWAKISARDFAETGAKPEDTEGFVNVIAGLRDTDVAAMLREEEAGTVRVSFRSRGQSPVNGAAEALGGGGHKLAAACVLEGTLEDAESLVIKELSNWTEF